MAPFTIRGYCDRPSVAPGETLEVAVALDPPGPYEARLVRLRNGHLQPEGTGPDEEVVEHCINGIHDGQPQRTQAGSHIVVTDPATRLHPASGLTVHVFVWPTTPGHGRQGIIARWDEDRALGWALILDDGAFAFTVGDGQGGTAIVRADRHLFAEVWYSVVASWDPVDGTLALSQITVINSVNSRFGPVVPIDATSDVTADATVSARAADVPLVMAGLVHSAAGERPWIVAPYNGKLDHPSIYAGALDPDEIARLHAGAAPARAKPLAHWDFAAGIGREGIPTDEVTDRAGGLDGTCVNQPERAMTGWNWTGDEDKFVHAPEQYGAIWFHEDSLDDCRWPTALRLKAPPDLPSGCYAVRLDANGSSFRVPFFVTAPAMRPAAPILVLIPTFSYIVYANSQVNQNAIGGQLFNGSTTVLEAIDFELNERICDYGLSTYDLHADGAGVHYATWRRPLLSMQSSYQHEFGAVWQFPADLQLIAWLEAEGYAYDIATDHDVQREGVDLFRRYNVVVTGTHPEYCSRVLVNAWEEYLCGGGRGMYVGGNGLYWVVSQHPQKPWVMEVRRGENGDQAWRGRPGELYHSTTGEKGGLWRFRGRAPQKIWGTGYTSHTMVVSGYFEQLPDARDPRVAWILEGIEPDERIGDFGSVKGGAAGLEIDRYDLNLGTPPHTLLLASSVAHGPNAMLVPEEILFAHPAGNGEESPLVRADITYFTTLGGGAMFATSSMSWCGSLSSQGFNNNVARMTRNVLTRFASDEPLEEVV